MAAYASGGPRTVGFEQSNLKAFLDQRHKDGVCAALVIEWLAGGGDLSRQRPTRGLKTKQRIEKLEDRVLSGGVFEAFQEYGLVRAGGDDIISSERRTTDDLVDFICGTISYYYIALNATDDVGHALGAITEGQGGKYFDPNGHEITFDRNLAQYRSTVKGRSYTIRRSASRTSSLSGSVLLQSWRRCTCGEPRVKHDDATVCATNRLLTHAAQYPADSEP